VEGSVGGALIFFLHSADERDRRVTMSLGIMAGAGFVAAIVLIVVTVTLINKFAN
jgi:heme/copper-type cytochrome/quinol oxidase subunit 4